MTVLHVVVLALIQGLTEFLPVSSSAHLIFPSELLGWEDQGIAFDVSLHVGTLLAVVFYYWSDLKRIAFSTLESCVRRKISPDGKLGLCIILATVPACVAGLIFERQIATIARSIEVIAWTTIGYGLLLGLASLTNRRMLWKCRMNEPQRPDSLQGLGYVQALIIGFAQALAIVPGTSRSGITLTAGLFLGLSPAGAARFSFLLSIPIILASASFEALKLMTSHAESNIDLPLMALGVLLSFITALTVIYLFMQFISKSGMAVFVVYRVLLGVLLLWLF